MDVSVLVHAVLEYLKANRPTTPQESNFQAELKAASHWYWFKENEPMQFESRHFDDVQLKKVAKLALEGWTKKLDEVKHQAQKLLSTKQGDTDDSDSSDSIDDEISGDCKLLLVVKLQIPCIIIHQIFSIARDWSKRVTWANIPRLTMGNIREYSQFLKLRAL